jgi:hypothetical protein
VSTAKQHLDQQIEALVEAGLLRDARLTFTPGAGLFLRVFVEERVDR